MSEYLYYKSADGRRARVRPENQAEFERNYPDAKIYYNVKGQGNAYVPISNADAFKEHWGADNVSYGVVEDWGVSSVNMETGIEDTTPTRKEERQARREERQNDGKTTFGETLGKSAAAAGVRTGKLALDLARAAWNTGVVGGAINLMTGKKFDEKLRDEDSRLTQWSTKLGETADRLSREADPTGGEKGYVDLIKEGNIGQVAQKALASGIESLPMMLAAGSGWGMLLYGAGMAAGEYSDETRENPDIPSWKRAINSMGSAALEMAVEKIGGPLNDLGKAGKEITEDMAKEILETAVKEGSDHIAKRIVKKLGTMVKQGAEEGVEEVITSFGNDVLGTSLDLIDGDADYGIQAQWNQLKEQNPDASLADFAKEKGKEYMDAFIGGAVSGLEISTTTEGLGAGVNALRNNESRNIMQHAREVGSSMSYDDLYDTDSDVANAKTAVANSFADKDGNPTISNEFIESLSAEDAYALAGREDFSYQQRRAFGELAIAKAKSDALNGRLDTMRDERVATIRSRMEKASENGQIVTGMVDGRVVYVRGGKVNNREVSVDKHGGHGPLLVIDSVTGEEKVVNSKDITSASVLNAEETINGMVNFILNNEASDRQTARTTMSKRAKIAAVNEFIGKRMMINSENGIIEVEVTASPQSGKVLIKGKKGDLGGQAIKPMDSDVFYDSIYRNENGEPIFVEKGEGETEEVEVPETPTAPEAPVVAGVAEEDDFRDFTGTILVDGAPLNVSVISQDGPSDTIVYEYEDENGNTRRASTTIGAFKAAVQQGAEYAPEAPVVPETPVVEAPVAEEVPPTEETPTAPEAPVEVELGPDDIDWDALFESDPEAYFVELQKQFGDGAIDMLTAVVEATQEELDGLNKNKGKTQKEIFANVTKKKELQNKIDILNGMIERLTAAPDTAPEVVPEPAPDTETVTETPPAAPAEEPTPVEPVEAEPVEEPAPEAETPPTDPDEEDGTGPIDPKAKEIVLDNGYIIKDGYVINPTPIEMPNSPKDFSRIFLAEKDGKWGYQTYVKFDNLTAYGSLKGAIQVSASHLWFDTKEEAIKSALNYIDYLKNNHGTYNGKSNGTTGIDAFVQYVKDTYLNNDPTATEKPEGGETTPETPTEPKATAKPKVKIPKFNVKDILLKGTGPTKGNAYTGVLYEDGYAVSTNGFVLVAKKEAYPAENEGKVITPKGEELSVRFPKWQMLLKDFVNKEMSFGIQDMYEFVMSIKDKYGKQWGDVTIEIEDKNGNARFFKAQYLLPFLKAANEIGGELYNRTGSGFALMISSDKGTAIVQSYHQANTNNERYNAPVPQTNEPSPQPAAPTAPTVVDNPIEVAKMKDANLLKQIMRIDIPTAQKRDLAYSTGKQVADLFATREEYDAYAENAQNFGAYNEDYERGVDASFANRPQNPDDTPGKSVPLENEPKGGENGGEKDAPKGDDTVRPADGGTGGGTDNGGSKAGDKGNPKAIPSQGKGGSEGGKESGKVKHQYPARKGNVTGKILVDTFGLAAVDIPNSRKEILNTFYDFMMEMSKVLGISPKSIGNGGWLTLGNLRANARAFARHTVLYKTFGGDIVEQHLLLKYSRVSSIAHEWWHALDHALSFFEKGKNKGPTTEIATGAFDGRQETLEAVRAIMKAIRDSGYTSRIQSHPLYTRDFKNYVLEPTESAARAFAEYMRNKFAENGIAIAGVNEFYDDTQPTAEEMKLITPAIENLFNVLQEKDGKTPGTSILYHIGEMMDEQSDAKKLATEAVLTALDDTGIDVVRASDEQTQQMIDASGENTEFMISPDNPVFVSNAAMAVAGIKMEKATPEQWLKMIEKAGGLKVGEDKWIGLSDWLKTSDKKTLTKKEVLDYIHENEIKIEEVNYAEIDYFAEDKKFIDAINAEYLALRKEAEDAGEWIHDAGDIAYQQMVDKYGDDFSIAFGVDRGELYVSNREAASAVTGVDLGTERAIDETRIGYTTEGLSNNKEIALVVPTIESWNESDEIHFGDAGNGRAVAWVRFGETEVTVQDETQQRLNEIYDRLAELEMKVSSTGITEEEYNERARLRTERDELQEIKPKTQRVLVIDEIQSKRHQEGRESGYKVSKEKADAEMDKFMKRMHEKYDFSSSTPFAEVFNEEEMRELARLTMQQHRATFGGMSVPDAPFDKNWHELAMKRMLRYAAENGYDAIAWTKGEQQAERYNMESAISAVYASKDGEKYYVEVYDKDGEEVTFNGLVGDSRSSGSYTADELKQHFGAEAAKVIVKSAEALPSENEVEALRKKAGETRKEEDIEAWRNARSARIDGDKLFRGEGMKGFYDRMLPAFMNKYGKKWGIKVADITLPNVERAGRVMHSVPVTDAMKESVMEGQPMFMKRPNGTVYGWTDGKKIYLTKAGINPNTPVHEYTHLWAKAMMQKNPKGWQSIKDLLRGTPVWNEVLNDPNYSSIHSNEDLVASEVLSRISGTQNAAKLEQMAQQMIDEAKGTARKLEARGLIQNIKDALNKFWNWVGTELFGIEKFESVEQVTDRVLWDLMNATDLGNLEEGQTEFSIIPEGELKEKLKKEIEDGEYITLYRAVRKINGKYYSPKMSKLGGVGQEIVLGELEQSDERPDLAYPVTMADGTVKYKVNLDGSDPAGTGLKSRTTNKVDYNPYIHASDSMMNDQFTAAFAMPEMTVIEVRVPKSELTSGYHAEKAADHVGKTPWKSGTVDLKLPKDEQRNVYLSRYDMPVREVPTEEIADHIAAKLLRNGLSMPYNLVTPQVAEALIRRGVDVSETPSGNVPAGQNEKFKELKERVLGEMKENDNDSLLFRSSDRKVEEQNAAVDYLAGEPRLRAIENAVNEETSKLGVKVTYKTREQMPEGHKNEKGYFDPKTGEVVVCTENASSIADAIQTILHEAVAHKGLRQLMGDAFDEFISRVYDSLDAETKAKVDAIADKHYAGDKAVAMEEYMATLAENTDFENKTLWDKIKSIFEDIINSILGRNDIKIGDNELRYILRASYNNMVNPRGMETIRGWAQDKMMREGYGINNAAKIAEMDAAYMKAVEDGDMETAQRLVLEAAKLAMPNTKVVDENGNPMVVYHGSPYGAITEFDHKKGKTSGLKEFGSFFATNLKVAEMYRDQRELPKALREQIETEIERLRIIQYDVANSRDYDAIEAEINRLRDALSGKVYATFLNITNPKTFDAKGKDGWAGWHELKQDVGYDVKSGTEAIEAITGNNDAAIMPEQYDGIIAENIADIHSTDDVSDLVGDVFLVWNPSQIKSAEAVTYDDNGNVIPLSKRFNLKSNDIRYRTGIDPDEAARETAKAVYERIVNENWQEFQRQFQDAMQPVRIAIDAIQQETGNLPIEDYENFLLMFNQASSRSRVEIDDFSRRYYSPIIESINEIVNSIIEARGGNTSNKKERAYAYQEIMNYLIAKHGLERNKYYQSTKTRKLTEAEKAKAVSKAQKAYDDAIDAINAMELSDEERADMLGKAQEQFNAELEDIETREVPDMRDYSGLTSLFGFPPKKFKEAEDEAQRLVDDFERMLGRVDDESGETVTPSEQIEKLWKNINAATSKTLRHSYESGMLSRQQYNDIKDMFKFYIPLRGFDETTAEDVYSYARFEGNRFNPAVHKAKGRTSVADDPIATIMNMAESEIAQGNKNRAKQALYYFLLNRAAGKADQNSLMQVERVWYLVKKDELDNEYYEIAVPNRDAGETYEEFEERMKILEAEEKAVKSKKGKLKIGMRFQKPANMNAHYVFLKVNGVEKAIYINGDPKAAQAINGEHKKQRGALAEKMGILNRFISSMFTNYSLEFTARNYFRDMFYSHINIDVKESDPAYRKKFRQNWRRNNLRSMVKMLKAYRAGEYEGRDLNEDEMAFVEFMRNGGQTGYTLINSVETHKKDLERAIANMQKGIEKGGVKDSTIFKFTLGSIELLNEASELVTRFAAFKTSRDMGRGINTSIADAKEVTVNFNTKGAQDGKGFMGMIAHYFGWSKYFFNASVQGVQNLKSMAEANKLKFGSVIGGMVATGFLMPVITSAIASLFGNDDEEYWNIPEYERQNNFCVPIGNGKYVKVPLPIGFREVYAIGDMVAGAAFNKKFTRDLSQVGTDIANKLASIILPINPLESTANGLSVWHTIAYAAAPSSAQFLIQNLTNTDWKGAPLQKEYTYNEDDPQWMKAFGSNPDWMKGLSKWCNEHINLDGDYKGMDWSPEQLDNTLSNVFGGIYSLVKKTGKSISMIWNEENRNLSNIPLSGVVLGSGIDNDDRFVTDAYYDMKEYYDSNVNYIKRMAKRFGYDLEDVFEKEKGKHHPKMNEIYSNENFDFMQEWYTGVKELDAINDKIKKLDKKIAAKETPTEQDMLKWSRLNDKYLTERRDFVNDMLELD